MRDKIVHAIFLFSFFSFAVLWGAIALIEEKENIAPRTLAQPMQLEEVERIDMPVIATSDMFYNPISFSKAIDNAKNEEKQERVEAVIVPHHLVASDIIASVLNVASGREINNVVIIGPNHDNVGFDPVVSVKAMWQTDFGLVRTNISLTDRLLADLNTNENLDAFKQEHSIGAIIPFVKYYFPRADILPIVVSSYADERDALALSQWLKANLGQDSLIIYSIDFSHYLEYFEAQANDQITRDLIINEDIKKVLTLDNDYVDSPVVLAVALYLAQKKGLDMEIRYHANSADYIEPTPVETTSYFGILFSRQKVL